MRRRLPAVIAFTVLLAAIIGLQVATGSYHAEFGGHPDEAAHYVTGLMVRDYLAAGQLSDPMGFARDYYDHYPKVAFGHWPPVFYAVQAGWMLLLPPNRCCVLLLMALLTALLASRVFLAARRDLGLPAACFATVMLLALPIVQQYSGMVMAEILLTLLCFLAVEAYGRYLTAARARDAAWFGIYASLAILTKQTAAWLALMVPIAVLLTWRRQLILRWSFWLPAAMVLLFCGPWTYLTLEMVRNGWTHPTPTWSFSRDAAGFYATTATQILHWPLLLLSLLGTGACVIAPAVQRKLSPSWTVRLAAMLALVVFHIVMPSALEARYLIPALPMAVLFAAGGARTLIEGCTRLLAEARLRPRPSPDIAVESCVVPAGTGHYRVSLCVIGALCALSVFDVPHKGCGGFATVANELLTRGAAPAAPLVISSDAAGEGMFIAEVAARDTRPTRIVIRGTKLMAESDWMKLSYEARFNSPTELMNAFRQMPAPVLVVDEGVPARNRLPHQQLVKTMLQTFPEAWERLGRFDVERDRSIRPGAIAVYRLKAGTTPTWTAVAQAATTIRP